MSEIIRPRIQLKSGRARSLALFSDDKPTLTGFRYFWLKYITSFNGDAHCAQCFRGTYEPLIRKDMPLDDVVELTGSDRAQVRCMYLCGVALPYYWEHNFHVPFIIEPGQGSGLSARRAPAAISVVCHRPFATGHDRPSPSKSSEIGLFAY